MSTVLASKVLVLNRGFAPVRTTTVRNAFLKLFSDIAEAVTVEEGRYVSYDFSSWAEISELRQALGDHPPDAEWVHTPRLSLIVPRVIRLLTYDNMPKYEVKLTRKNIFERDNYTCQYTGQRLRSQELNIDHVVPRSRGGASTWENLVTCSVEANNRKGDRTPHEAGMRLIRKPFKPSPRHAVRLSLGPRRYSDWDHFVSDLYWNTELKDGD
jgi:5-methylcytosine-specific restriction endonuclease McrA